MNHKRVARLMRRHGMAGRFRRRRCRTTFPGEGAYVIPDLVGRRFEPGVPDVALVQDITYIPTQEGWLYLASVLDLGSCRLLRCSMADNMRTELVLDALGTAAGERGGNHAVGSVIAHADRGSQYMSNDYLEFCQTRRCGSRSGVPVNVGTARILQRWFEPCWQDRRRRCPWRA